MCKDNVSRTQRIVAFTAKTKLIDCKDTNFKRKSGEKRTIKRQKHLIKASQKHHAQSGIRICTVNNDDDIAFPPYHNPAKRNWDFNHFRSSQFMEFTEKKKQPLPFVNKNPNKAIPPAVNIYAETE